MQVLNIDTGSSVQSGFRFHHLYVTIKDDPAERNFYNIKLRSWHWEYVWDPQTNEEDSNLVYGTVWFSSDDPVLTGSDASIGGNGFGQRGASFNDDLFEGGDRTIELDAWLWETDAVDVTVSSGTEEFYLYEVSYSKYQETRDNPFAQPVQVYTNVRNGLGIFAGVSSTTQSVEF